MKDHGGDWAGFQREYGRPPLDFSANVSPLGVPDGVRRAAEAALSGLERYPDPLCRELREKLAADHGVPAGWILCGSGAADLIYRLAAAERPRAALVTAPTFSEYENALTLWGCRVTRLPLSQEEDFALPESILSAVTPQTDLLFLCEPNNPTGRTTDRRLLQRILERCTACGTRLAVDECFNDFLDDPPAHTLLDELSHSENLLILRAFTKSHGLAGLRLGYALSQNTALLRSMARCGPPWAVSAPAQAAGAAALEETAYLAALRDLIRRERPYLAAGLAALGCRVCPGEANYLLFFHGAPGLSHRLAERGVLIRNCSNYCGLGPGWYRAAVRGREENAAFLAAMKEVL